MMKSPQRRGPLQIIFAVLRSAREPIKKTRFMYVSNIGYAVVNKYLSFLLEKDLIETTPYVRYTDRGRPIRQSKRTKYLYVITDKGKALIDLFERIYDILGWSELA